MAQRICPNCGHVENEYTFFCTECGSKTVLEQGVVSSPSKPITSNQSANMAVKNVEPDETEHFEEPKEDFNHEAKAEEQEENHRSEVKVQKANASKRAPAIQFEWKKWYTYVIIGAVGVVALIILLASLPDKKASKGEYASSQSDEIVEKVVVEEKPVRMADESVTEKEPEVSPEVLREPWKATMLDYINMRYRNEKVTFFDLNGDGKQEIAVYDGEKCDLLTISEDNIVDELSADNCLVVYQERRNMLCTASSAGSHSTDAFYEISNGKWNKIDDAECNVGFDEYRAEPVFDYYVNGSSVDANSYFTWLASGYEGGENIQEEGYVSVKDACEILETDITFEEYASKHNIQIEDKWEYHCENRAQIFIPPVGGTYEFELKGAAGGADGERVIDGTVYYDSTGAELVGSMQLGAGEKVIIVVGGAGGVSQIKEGVVAGGFNGGGDTYWSGGGGGSTDLYTIEGVRVASAAGAGGGNYGGYGEPGRISTSPKTGSTDGKLGGGTGHTMNQSAGAGGGAGWYGGSAGPEDGVGHGGISGYNEYDFKFFYENPGHNGVDSNEVNGHVVIRKIGD